MRRMLRAFVAALVVAAIGSPLPSEAQDMHELERRVDVAVAARREATAALDAYRRRERAPRMFTDTLVILDGTVLLLTDREFLPIVRDASALVETFVRGRAGAGMAALRGTVFAVWSDSIRRAEHGLAASPRANERETDVRYVIANAPSLAQILEMHLQERIGMRNKPRLREWLGGPLPLAPATNTEWRVLRLELVSSVSVVAHRCFAGDLAACKVTLGFVTEADPATAWYDSTTRRELVRVASSARRLERHMVAQCLAGRDSVCVALLRTSPAMAQWLAPPGSGRARATLVQQAFSMGQPGALARLVASSDLPPDALSAIASVPLDSLLSHWQRHAHDGGVESESATPVIALAALGWILAMGALSLRSPRWR